MARIEHDPATALSTTSLALLLEYPRQDASVVCVLVSQRLERASKHQAYHQDPVDPSLASAVSASASALLLQPGSSCGAGRILGLGSPGRRRSTC